MSGGASGVGGGPGISGMSGADGLSGISGVSGTGDSARISGLSGVDGTTGISGVSGMDGATGISGVSGMDGATGNPGVSGMDDAARVSEAFGLDGVPGASIPGLAPSPPVAHGNGHTVTSEAAHPRRFDVLTPPRAQDPADGGPSSPLGPDGLPHRVRQANLAPQLRSDTSGESGNGQGRHPRARRGLRPPRTPEQNQATMSAFQRGFTRGRAEEPDTPPSSTPSPATEADGGPADHDERGEGPR